MTGQVFNNFLVTSLSPLFTWSFSFTWMTLLTLAHSSLTLILSTESQGQKELAKSSSPTPASTCASSGMWVSGFQKQYVLSVYERERAKMIKSKNIPDKEPTAKSLREIFLTWGGKEFSSWSTLFRVNSIALSFVHKSLVLLVYPLITTPPLAWATFKVYFYLQMAL